MDSRTIKDLCIRSCDVYRAFLEEAQADSKKKNMSGMSVTDVNDITYSKNGEVRLKVPGRIRISDDLFLSVNGRSYYTEQTHEMVYDPLRKEVSFFPADEVIDDLRRSSISDVKLVSDMKWLIDVTRTYYDSYGHLIRYPDRLCNLYGREEFCLPEGRTPSEEQVSAVEGILNDTTSYVWGAPGAGKTQYVLATAIMTCVRDGERVAVIAPTNNALEQVLRGLIDAIRKSDPNGEVIDVDNDILRLGTASQQFSDEFPNVCERREVSKLLERNRSEILRLEAELNETTDPKNWDRIRASIRMVKERIRPYEEFDPAVKERNVSIIAMTPHRLMMRYSPTGDDGRLPLDVDRIFLDEAGYTSLINTLPLFTFGVPVSMLGDHMQLPPVCEMESEDIREASEDHTDKGDCYPWVLSSLYSESMLTLPEDDMRLSFIRRDGPIMERTGRYNITASYRFGERLAKLLDRYVYDGIGLSGRSSDELVLEVIDVVYTERTDRNNLGECEAVLDDIMKNGLERNDYAILATYGKQVGMFKKALKYDDSYNVFTVHRSQGKEWDTVYLSVVDNRHRLPDKDVQLRMTSTLTSKENLCTLNTALSRAKKRLVIVCDVGFWMDRTGDLIGELVSQADRISRFEHDPSNPIRFRERAPGSVKDERRLYHNGVNAKVGNTLYAVYKSGDLKIGASTMHLVYDYCKSDMLTHEGMEIVRHIELAYGHVRSGDYEDAAEELREAVRLHERSR